MKRWVVEVNGAPGTLYDNEKYQLQVDFPEHYPMEAPQVDIYLHFIFLVFSSFYVSSLLPFFPFNKIYLS